MNFLSSDILRFIIELPKTDLASKPFLRSHVIYLACRAFEGTAIAYLNFFIYMMYLHFLCLPIIAVFFFICDKKKKTAL
jgi:hypothetical protein